MKKHGQGGGPGSCGGCGRQAHHEKGSQITYTANQDHLTVGNGDESLDAEAQAEEQKSDDDVQGDEIFASAWWTNEEQDALFSYYLCPEADDVFQQLKSNAKYAHGKV